jgi:hypothetical protein
LDSFVSKEFSKTLRNQAPIIIISLASLLGLIFFYVNSIEFNPRWLWSKYRYLYPYVIAQAKFETANFTSDLFKRANNAFGMRIPFVRNSKNVGSDNGYSVYNSQGQCLSDFFLYLDAVNINDFKPSTIEGYTFFLKEKGYFDASLAGYTNGLKSYMK